MTPLHAQAQEEGKEEQELRRAAEELRKEIALLEKADGDEVTAAPPAEESMRQTIPGEPLAGSTWDVTFDIGREKGTWMPQMWGSRGERFVATLEGVCFDCEPEKGGKVDDFLAGGAGGPARRLSFAATRGSSPNAKDTFPSRAKVRNFPRLAMMPGCWRRVGKAPSDGGLRWFATLPEGLDGDDGGGGFDGRGSALGTGAFGPQDGRDSTLSLPAGDVLYFATPAWGDVLSSRGGIISVRRNAIWRREYRIVGTWRAVRRS